MGACGSKNEGGVGGGRQPTPTKEGMDRALARLVESNGNAGLGGVVEKESARVTVTTPVAKPRPAPLKEEKLEEEKKKNSSSKSGGDYSPATPMEVGSAANRDGTVESDDVREARRASGKTKREEGRKSSPLSTEATVQTSPTPTTTNAALSDASVATNPSPSGRESLGEVERVEKEKETIRRRRVDGETLENEEMTTRTSYNDETIADLRRALSETLPPSSLSAAASTKTAKNRTTSTTRVRRHRGERGGNGSTPAPSRLQSLMHERERARTVADYHDAEYDDGNRSDEDRAPRRKGGVVKKEDVERRVRKELRRQAREETSMRRRETAEEEGGDAEERGDGVVVEKQNLRVSLVAERGATPKGRRSDRGYHSQLDKLLAIAERAGSTAERVHSDITDLDARVNTVKAVPMQPWEERGNAWAGDRRSRNSKSNREDEKSSSAGTILNPKNKLSKEVRQALVAKSDDACSSPRSPEKPKLVTSVLRSDLLKSMGEMSADEKLERLGLKSVPEDDGSSDGGNGSSNHHSPHMSRSARSTPVSRRRDWQERTRRTPSLYSDEDETGFTPPPAPAPSVHSNWDSVGTPSSAHQSPMNYVGRLKAQAKLARAESARSWKVGVGVRNGASEA